MDVHQFPDAAPGSGGNGAREPVVKGSGIVRRYGQGDTAVDALRGVSVDIAQGRLTAVMRGCGISVLSSLEPATVRNMLAATARSPRFG